MRLNPFLLKLHWGDPKHPTEIRAWTGALGFSPRGEDRYWQHCYVSHQIGRWYGISYERSGFLGLCVFGPSEDYRTSVAPRFGPFVSPSPPPARGRDDADGGGS
jgi:hypothetical protein